MVWLTECYLADGDSGLPSHALFPSSIKPFLNSKQQHWLEYSPELKGADCHFQKVDKASRASPPKKAFVSQVTPKCRSYITVSYQFLVLFFLTSLGLDPAYPGFGEGPTSRRRLTKTDARFVDVIHSNARYGLNNAIGLETPLGHADFYPNGGSLPASFHFQLTNVLTILV